MVVGGHGPDVRRTPTRLDQLVFAIALAASMVILFWPTVPGPPLFPFADKVIHFGLFAALGWSGVRAGLAVGGLAAGLAAYAVASEILQGALLPDRAASWSDLMADLIGAAVGLIAARATRGR